MAVRNPLKRRDWLLLSIALLAYCGLAVGSVSRKSMTSDEGAHLVAGYAYWTVGDFRLQPENGNWPQRWAALPLVLGGVDEDVTAMPGWRQSDVWTVSDAFLYGSSHDADALLLRGRAIASIIGALTGLVAFLWARSLFGPAAGWVTLIVFALSPTMLAYGPLTTSDMMATLFFTAAIWLMWKALHRLSIGTLSASVLCVAGVLLSKFSAPVLVPMALVLIVIRCVAGRPLIVQWRGETKEISTRSRIISASAALLIAHAMLAVGIIWLSYGFRFAAMSPTAPSGDFLVPWQNLSGELGWMGAAVSWMREHRVLPEAYLYGFTQTAYYAQHRVAFFNGQTSDVGGWTGFFPYAFSVKETIPVLVLVAWCAVQLIRRRRYDVWPLVVLIVVYWSFALASHLNIGYRHLLPTLPAMYVLVGSIAAAVDWCTWRRTIREMVPAVALTVLLAWHAAEALVAAPNFIAYFNERDGGPSQAYKHLVDSSLDWGQDLPGLKRWLDENDLQRAGHDPVFLSYFGTARPSHYGIDAVMLPGYPDKRPPGMPPALRGGVYCISATMLQGIYLDAGRDWTAEYQRNYDALLFNLRVFDSTATDPKARARLIQQTGEAFWMKNFATFDQLRFARLAAYLRGREPDANAGHSILIFRLSDAQVQEALFASPRP